MTTDKILSDPKTAHKYDLITRQRAVGLTNPLVGDMDVASTFKWQFLNLSLSLRVFFSVKMMKTRRLLPPQGYPTAEAFNALLK